MSPLRPLLALVFMGVGLVSLVVDGVNHGWSTLGTVGVACFAVAVGAELLVLRRTRAHQ